MSWHNESVKHSLARYKGLRRKYPLRSSGLQLKRTISKSNKQIKKSMGSSNYKRFLKLQNKIEKGYSSKSKYLSNGEIDKNRKRKYSYILRKQFEDKSTIDKKDPDLYILGGVPASGKTKSLVPNIKEKTIVINNDDYKSELAKFEKPPIKKFPLAHSGYFHDEAGNLVKIALNKAKKEKRDTTIDMTFGNYDKGKEIIKDFKKEGYDIHLLATQLRPHYSVRNATWRFLNSNEKRYVPLRYIASEGNDINKNVLKARRLADDYKVYDTTDFKNPILISKSRKK